MTKALITTLASSLLLFTGSLAGAQTARARIADTPIRGEANLASAIIATLNEGSPVDVVDLQGEWYRVLVPSEQGKARVGYVLVNLIEIVNVPAQPASLAARPMTQGAVIAPTLAQQQQQLQRAKAAEREQTLRAEVDALQAELKLLQTDQPTREVRARPVPPPVAHNLQAREGFWFNAGLGLGSLGCGGCDGTISGGSGGLSLGTTINDRLLLGGGSTGFYRSERGVALSVGMLDARLRFYPVRASGFFLTGGIGLGTVTAAAAGFGSTSQSGVAMILGLGWDIRVRPNLSLTPFWNGLGVATSGGNVNVGQLGLGMTVH